MAAGLLPKICPGSATQAQARPRPSPRLASLRRGGRAGDLAMMARAWGLGAPGGDDGRPRNKPLVLPISQAAAIGWAAACCLAAAVAERCRAVQSGARGGGV